MTEDSLKVEGLEGVKEQISSGSVRTVFIFVDLPVHIEYRVGVFPFLPPGTEIEFDSVFRNPRDSVQKRQMKGTFFVSRRVLRYETNRPGMMGLTQYLEWTVKSSNF